MKKQDLKLQDFPLQTFDKIRYADTDRQGHVNNAVFATFLETGRVEFLYHSETPLHDKGASFVIVNLNLNLHAEINWPGKIEIGTGVTKVGRSSLHLLQVLFQNGHQVATAHTVIVQLNNDTRESQPLSDESRSMLEMKLLHLD